MRLVAFDSKKIVRKAPLTNNINFKAMLGVGVTINDYQAFGTKYIDTIQELFDTYGFPKNRLVYKSSDLAALFHGKGIDILPILIEKLIPHIDFIDIYFSYFLNFQDRTQPFMVGVYWEEELERLHAPQFIDLIDGPYAAICCHAYLKQIVTPIDSLYFIDDCPGLKPSIATSNVIKNPKTRFLFKGDQINFGISIADLLCKYIDLESLQKGFRLNKDLIQNIEFDGAKCKTTFIGPDWLRDIKPSRKINLEINHKHPHPAFF